MSRNIEYYELGFKNGLRYGSQWTIFKFENGLVNIFGKNGIGKSSVIELLHYALFGVSYRGVNLDKLINKVNKSGFEVYVSFGVTIDNVLNKYLIKRGLAPKIEQIFKNDKTKPETIPGRFNNYIVEKILGYDANINKKIISVHSKNGSFITMELKDRRQIIDSIVNLTQTKDYLKHAKTMLSEAMTKKALLDKDIEHSNKEIEPIKKIIENASLDKQSRIIKYTEQINNEKISEKTHHNNILLLNNEAKEIENKINIFKDEENLRKSEYMKLDPEKLNSDLFNKNGEFVSLKNDAKRIKNDISKIVPNTICPNCGNSYTEEQAKEKISEKNKEYLSIKNKAINIKKELDELYLKIETAKGKHKEVEEITSKIYELKNSLNDVAYRIRLEDQSLKMCQRNISDFESSIDDINNIQSDASGAEARLNEIQNEILEYQDKMSQLHEEIDSLNYIIEMFSDEGIKSLVLKKFLPILNKLINHYLKVFNLPLSFEITADYNYTMSTTDFLADDFEGLSGGQQQRINLAILFAQTDLIKIIGNFKTNILFLDEYIDGAVDEEGLNDTIDILKGITKKDNKSIIFISHRLNDSIISNIDIFYHARKYDTNFSELVKVSKEEVSELLHAK